MCRKPGGEETAKPAAAKPKQKHALLTDLEFKALPKRCLTEETCKKWKYGVGADKTGRPVQVAQYCNEDGVVVAQKLRTPDKDFTILGDPKAMTLYGQWLWSKGGLKIVVTEGEVDALTMSQLQDNKWPVVSVPNGASGAADAVRKNLEYLDSFGEVIFMFDMDEPGLKAARECAKLIRPGRAKIAKLPLKDPNACLQDGKGKAVVDAMWRAEAYRPPGILDARAVYEELKLVKSFKPVAQFPMRTLDLMTRGIRRGEIVTYCSGSGMGKTEFVRQCALELRKQGLKLGYIPLEEQAMRAMIGLLGMHMGQQLKFEEQPALIPGFEEAWKEVCEDHIFFFNQERTEDSVFNPDELLGLMRYLRIGCGVDAIVLDHISYVVAGAETDDERRFIDEFMTKLAAFCETTGCILLLVSHLKQPMRGRPLEEGGKTSLSLLRGSRSIGQLSNTVIGLERNQQDPQNRDVSTIRVLKCRWTGQTGFAGYMEYQHGTGRLIEREGAEGHFAPVHDDGAEGRDF